MNLALPRSLQRSSQPHIHIQTPGKGSAHLTAIAASQLSAAIKLAFTVELSQGASTRLRMLQQQEALLLATCWPAPR